VASIPVEAEDGTVFAADLNRLARVGALVEQVAAWLRILVGNPFADGLPVGGRRLETVGGRIERAGGFSFFARREGVRSKPWRFR